MHVHAQLQVPKFTISKAQIFKFQVSNFKSMVKLEFRAYLDWAYLNVFKPKLLLSRLILSKKVKKKVKANKLEFLTYSFKPKVKKLLIQTLKSF